MVSKWIDIVGFRVLFEEACKSKPAITNKGFYQALAPLYGPDVTLFCGGHRGNG